MAAEEFVPPGQPESTKRLRWQLLTGRKENQ